MYDSILRAKQTKIFPVVGASAPPSKVPWTKSKAFYSILFYVKPYSGN